MNIDKGTLVRNLIKFAKEAEKKNLIWGPSGNISCRLDENTILITSSGAHLGELREENFVVMDLENKKVEGEKKPSIEFKMHTGVYKIQNDAKAVFHSQPFFTTLISCTDLEVDTNLFPESMAYINRLERVPYNHPGSQELANSVSAKAKECDIIILSNHGAICWGRSLDEVLLKTETLEMLCKMIAMAKVGEMNLNFIPERIKTDFLKFLEDLKETS
jgi:ribulose-5-phosphate 4-epimerase/fuculose-1-phosphate aldolase